MDKYTRFYTDKIPEWLRRDYKGQRILDLGAGDGEILYGLWKNKLIDRNVNIVAVEILEERYRTTRKMLKSINLRSKCLNADATKLCSMHDSSFDFIICNQVIEHIEDDVKALEEMHRILKPDGEIYLSTVYKQFVNMGYYRNAKGERTLDPTHVREFKNENELKLKFWKKFKVKEERKTMQWFAVTDFILRRMNLMGDIYEKKPWLAKLRKIKLPIFGYYNWEMILCKER